ncbi:MAG TPA: hypothetical protein VFZ03_05050 [Dongiaceae bacterium]
MKMLIIAAAAAALLGAPAALAASTSNGNASNVKTESHAVVDTTLPAQCASLSAQFDRAEKANKTHKNYPQAVALGTEGKTLCSSNKMAAGVEYLGSAVKVFGTSSS